MDKCVKVICIAVFVISSCGKEFLDIKADSKLVIPKEIKDFQALLDNNLIITSNSSHELAAVGVDDYYVEGDLVESLPQSYLRNAYVWAKDVFEENEEIQDWNHAYHRVLYANMALKVSEIKPMSSQDQQAWNNVKGSALFIRAYAFYQLAQLFCKPYESSTANIDLGIPLRLDYDVTIKVQRGTLEETYNRIIEDLNEAAVLLPEIPDNKYRPGKAAAYALLARTYMQMGNYEKANVSVERALAINNQLLDFNSISNLDERHPFRAMENSNVEILFHSSRIANTILNISRFSISPIVFNSFDNEIDLRKLAYFFTYNDHVYFGGSLKGGEFSGGWTGLAVNELFLIHAECLARRGESEKAVDVLNELLKHRYRENKFIPYRLEPKTDLMTLILLEQRKELVFRGLRWETLRRLNKESKYATTLVREIGGKRYELPPDDPRWVWPIPNQEVIQNGLEQNVR